jgi:hypothetical protein
MAAKGGSQKTRIGNPNLTKNGKTRLGPLNVKQLTEMLEKASRPKDKSKIANRLRILATRTGSVAPAVEIPAEPTIEETTQESQQ